MSEGGASIKTVPLAPSDPPPDRSVLPVLRQRTNSSPQQLSRPPGASLRTIQSPARLGGGLRSIGGSPEASLGKGASSSPPNQRGGYDAGRGESITVDCSVPGPPALPPSPFAGCVLPIHCNRGLAVFKHRLQSDNRLLSRLPS